MAMALPESVDVVVVGAGPAGLAGALNLVRQGFSVALLDGNRPRHAATLVSHGFVTRDGIPPLELRGLGREEFLGYPTAAYERTIVHSVSPITGGFETSARSQGSDVPAIVRSTAVLIATGLTETLPLAAQVRQFYGTSLFSCLDCDNFERRGLPLALIGEHDDLADWARLVARHTDDLVVFTNGAAVVSADDEARLGARGVRVERRPVQSLEGDRSGLTAVVLDDGERIARAAGFVRPAWSAPLGFAESLGLALDAEGLVLVDAQQRASVPGVYAAGDITPGHRQLAVAAGQGTTAAATILRDLVDADWAVSAAATTA